MQGEEGLAALDEVAHAHVQVYPGAGHTIVHPGFGGPLSTFAYNPSVPGFFDFGGTPNGNCDAAFESSRAVLRFLDGIKQ